MTHQQTPVTFRNGEGQQLFGILHHAGDPRAADTAVLLLSPGVKMRVAPHRLYNKLAERFVTGGRVVLRFDFNGLGDSEGDAPEPMLADLYRATQLGRYVPDTVAALDWLDRSYGIRRVVAAGLCGGALTGLLTAQHDRRICALLALSIPVILDGSGEDASRYMPVAQLALTRDAYLRRLRVWEGQALRSWVRFCLGQSDYRQIARSMAAPIVKRWRARAVEPAPLEQPATTDNTNPHFAPAFFGMVSEARPVLLLFGESDRLYWEFDEKFVSRYRTHLAHHESMIEVHVTAKANHIFSFADWQTEVLARGSAWLDRVIEPAAVR